LHQHYSYHSLPFDDMIADCRPRNRRNRNVPRRVHVDEPSDRRSVSILAPGSNARDWLRLVLLPTIKDSRDLEGGCTLQTCWGFGMSREMQPATRWFRLTGASRKQDSPSAFTTLFQRGEVCIPEREDVLKALSGVSKTIGATATWATSHPADHDPVEATASLPTGSVGAP